MKVYTACGQTHTAKSYLNDAIIFYYYVVQNSPAGALLHYGYVLFSSLPYTIKLIPLQK